MGTWRGAHRRHGTAGGLGGDCRCILRLSRLRSSSFCFTAAQAAGDLSLIQTVVKKSSRPQPAIVQIQSADAEFSRELLRALIAAGLTAITDAEAAPEGAVMVKVLDEPRPETASTFSHSIILSSVANDALSAQALQHNAAALIVKPVSIPMLVTKIRLTVHQLQQLETLRRQVEKLGAMLNEEQTVSVAVGMIAERFHLPTVEAYERLRRHARSTQSKLQGVAAQMVSNVSSSNQLFRTVIASTETASAQSLATE